MFRALAPQLRVRFTLSRGGRCISHHGIGGSTCRLVHGRARVTMRLEPPRNACREVICSATLAQRACDAVYCLSLQSVLCISLEMRAKGRQPFGSLFASAPKRGLLLWSRTGETPREHLGWADFGHLSRPLALSWASLECTSGPHGLLLEHPCFGGATC